MVKFDYSDKDAVIPDSTQMLGYKPPTNYMIGDDYALSCPIPHSPGAPQSPLTLEHPHPGVRGA